METIKLESIDQVPGDYTGIVEFPNKTIAFHKDGKLHRTDGPAVEWKTGFVIWGVAGKEYYRNDMLENRIFLGIEKGKYGLEWIKLLTEEKIEEFPIIPGMRADEEIKILFEKFGV